MLARAPMFVVEEYRDCRHRLDLVEDVFRIVPLVDHCLDLTLPEPNRTCIGLSARQFSYEQSTSDAAKPTGHRVD
jgi:hypothetical protein